MNLTVVALYNFSRSHFKKYIVECIGCRAIIQTNVNKLVVVVDLIDTSILWLCGLITNGCLIKK